MNHMPSAFSNSGTWLWPTMWVIRIFQPCRCSTCAVSAHQLPPANMFQQYMECDAGAAAMCDVVLSL